MHNSDKYSGTIGVDDVIGKAAIIVWPVSRFGLLRFPGHPGHRRRGGRRSPPVACGLAGARPGAVGAAPTAALARAD